MLNRVLIELLRLAALLGLGLSLLGLALLVVIRVNALRQVQPAIPPESPGGVLYVLDAFKEAGVPFLLSAVLFVVCEIALRSTHRPPPPDREPDPAPPP